MKPGSELAERWNRVEWLKPREISAQAEALIQEHVRRIQKVIHFLVTTRGLKPWEAYALAQSAGHSSPGYEALLATLFQNVEFRAVGGARESLILAIASAGAWELDPDLGNLDNPWEPIIQVYELGYTSSFEEGPEGETLDLIIHFKNSEKVYPIVQR